MTAKWFVVQDQDSGRLSVSDAGILSTNQLAYLSDEPIRFGIIAQADTKEEAQEKAKLILAQPTKYFFDTPII
jgi:hypothetical protein